MDKKEIYLSASRIKALETCSWLYYCKYHLNVPEKSNSGAKRGTICHLIFEMLLNTRHKKHFKIITENKDAFASLAIRRLILKNARKEGIDNEEDLTLINKMILVGLGTDFFPKGGSIQDPEFEFKIEGNGYKAKGFIDLPILYKKEKVAKIRDYKSSRAKFKGDELSANVQAMLYSIASKKYWPEYKPKVEFVFLRFPKEPVQPVEFTDDQLSGFEYALKYVYDKIVNFSEKDAKENYAGDSPKNKWLCEAGKWVCPFKNPLFFYGVYDIEGNLLKTYLTLEEAKNSKINESHIVKKFKYDGCPRWK